MKQLNTYIKEGLFDNIGIGPKIQIEEWIKNNCETNYDLFIKEENNKYIVHARIIVFKKTATSLTNDMFEWGDVTQFNCGASKITSLEGGPKVCDWFECGNTFITSLDGAPKKCNTFHCTNCQKLTSLEGSPADVNEFDVSNCPNLKSLKGCTERVERFVCKKCNKLTSLEGIKWADKIDCSYCENLKNLKGLIGANLLTCTGCDKLNLNKYKNIYRIIK